MIVVEHSDAFGMSRSKKPPPPPPPEDDRRPRKNHARAWRKHRDMTLEELAEASGLSPSQISNIETGGTGYTWRSLEDLAVALNCEPGDLLSKKPGLDDEMLLLWKTMSEKDREAWLRSLKAFRGDTP